MMGLGDDRHAQEHEDDGVTDGSQSSGLKLFRFSH